MKKSIYLSGPDCSIASFDEHSVAGLSSSSTTAAMSWRSFVFHFCLKHGLQVINPLTEVKNSLNTDGKTYIAGDRTRKEVEQAFSLIDRCDFVICNLHNPDESSWVPLSYAHNKGKHAVVWTPFPVSPWLASYARASFEKLEHILDYILVQSDDMQKSILDWSIQYESSLKDRSEKFPNEGEADFQFFPGSEHSPFLVVAPHATSYWHLGSFREAESYTGAIAASLSRLTGAYSLVSSYSCPEDSLYTIDFNDSEKNLTNINNPLVNFITKVVRTHKIKFLIVLRSKPWESERGVSSVLHSKENHENSEAIAFTKFLQKKAEHRHINFRENPQQAESSLANLSQFLQLPIIELQIHRALLMPQLQRAQYHNLLSMLEEVVRGF